MIEVEFASELKPGTIYTWIVDIEDQTQWIQTLEKLLSSEELVHSRHYYCEQDRSRFIIRRAILRVLLSKYIGVKPGEIVYSANPYGKLSLPLQQTHFSTSHSNNKIALAFSSGVEVGVDIEQVAPLPDLEKLAEHWFSQSECVEFSCLDPAYRLEGFYHIWTQKEAFIKALGTGLAFPLRDFSVSADPRQPGRLLTIKDEDASSWKLLTDSSDPGWRLAVCVSSKNSQNAVQNQLTLQDFYSYFINSFKAN